MSKLNIEELMININKKFKTKKKGSKPGLSYATSSVNILSNLEDVPYWVPTGSSLLDAAVKNGIPGGKIIEISGLSATGKSALAYTILGNAQKMGGVGVLLDTECSVDADFAVKMGIDINRLIIGEPSSVEEVYNMTKDICDAVIASLDGEKSNVPIVVVADSCTSATLEEKAKQFGEEPKMGHNAKLQRRGLRTLMPYFQANGITFIGVNHLTAKLGGSPYGPKEEVTGGSSWRYYPHVRIKLGNMMKIKGKHTGSVAGVHVKAEIVKNRCGPPLRKVAMVIKFDTGFDDVEALLEYGGENGLFGVKQGWLEYEGQSYRKSQLNKYLTENPDKHKDIAEQCKQMLQTGETAVDLTDEDYEEYEE